MAISLVFTDVWNIANDAGEGDDTHNFSASVLEGDYVHLCVASDNSLYTDGGIATTGYNMMWRPNISAPGLYFAFKKMGATPDTSVDITKIAAKRQAIIMNVFRGADPDDFTDGSWGQANFGATTRINPPSVTSEFDNAWNFVLGFLDDDNSSSGAPTGFTNYAEITAGAAANVSCSIFTATRLQTTAGAYDPPAFQTHSSDAARGVHIAIKVEAADPDIGAELGATEATDIAALVGDVETDASFVVTEAQDMAAMAGDVEVDAVLTVSEASDTLAFVVDVHVDATFALTEATDTAAMVADVPVDASFVVTEATDVAAVVGDVEIDVSFITTEATDVAAVVGDVENDASFVATEATDTMAFTGTVTDSEQDAVLDATEATDTMSFTASGTDDSLREDADRPLTRALTSSLVGPRQH